MDEPAARALPKNRLPSVFLLGAALLFLLGLMLSCDCPGWFGLSGAAALVSAVWGARLVRVTGVLLCAASIWAAVEGLRHL
jgi:hypothetical protein